MGLLRNTKKLTGQIAMEDLSRRKLKNAYKNSLILGKRGKTNEKKTSLGVKSMNLRQPLNANTKKRKPESWVKRPRNEKLSF